MNFREFVDKHSRFSIGAANLACSFCTESSASFRVEVGTRHGWIDVHFPCNGHIKVQIRGALPKECLEPSWISQFVPAFLDYLGIAQDETYEAIFFWPTGSIAVSQPVDRTGLTDRIQTTRKLNFTRKTD